MTRTLGIDHIGLTVSNLEKSLAFFAQCLGWTQFGGNPDYPSAYVTDGTAKVTLWQVKSPSPVPFDRAANIGLHHLAFKIGSEEALHALYEKIAAWPGVHTDFAPEFSGKGPKIHCMIYEPGGNRLEFAFDPR